MPLGLAMPYSPKWKMLAASTASGAAFDDPVCEVVQGTDPTRSDDRDRDRAQTAPVNARSNPSRVPSRSMLVSRISPAPSSAMHPHQATASSPVARRPPWVNTSQRGEPPAPFSTCFASTATTMHCDPKRAAARATNSGSNTAAVLIDTLVGPRVEEAPDVVDVADAAAHGEGG